MKSNIAFIGTNGKLNRKCGIALAEKLEMYYLDYEKYVEYWKMSTKAEIISKEGKEKYHEYLVKNLNFVVTYDNTLLALPSGICNNSQEVAKLSEGAYLIYLSTGHICSKIKENCMLVIDTKECSGVDEIVSRVMDKIGELWKI